MALVVRRSRVLILFILALIVVSTLLISNSNSKYIDDLKSNANNYLKSLDESGSNNKGSNNDPSMENFDETKPLYDYSKDEINQINSIPIDSFLKGDSIIHDFFAKFFNLLNLNKSNYPLKRRMKLDDNGKPFIDDVHFFDNENELLSENRLLEFFDFPNDFVNDLTIKHKKIINQIPNFTPKFYKGDGYAIVGGGKYSWYSYLAVKSLRNVGAVLPVEVILPTSDDYEKYFCEDLLPTLNAKCVSMENVFGKEIMEKLNFTGYQLKSLALLASSFENIFLLDSDSYAVSNPEPLFKSDLYKKYKMITWPDFWRRTTSPIYYQIAGLDISGPPIRFINDVFTDIEKINLTGDKTADQIDIKEDYNLHDRKNTLMDWSTESGEMLLNKNIHFKTLLLALYYNFDGPYGYHPLLSQGGAGEGDKETFVAAATYFGLPFYQVYKRADKTHGFYNHLNTFEHGAIIQYDPLTDYKNILKIEERINHDMKIKKSHFKYDYAKYFYEGDKIIDSVPMFYHCHDPKFDPFFLINEKKMFVRENNQVINRRRRILGEDFPRGSIDLELSLWEIADASLCKQKMKFTVFEKNDFENFCNIELPKQLQFLRDSHALIMEKYNSETPYENLNGSNDLFGEKNN